MLAHWWTVQSETCSYSESKNMWCVLTEYLLPFIEFQSTAVCLLSTYEYMSFSWTTHRTVRMVKCSAGCSVTPPCVHHATLVSRSFVLPHHSPVSKANLPLILRRRSIMENVLSGIRRSRICVLVKTMCLILTNMCAGKHDKHITVLWRFLFTDHIYQRTTAGQALQHCYITLQRDLAAWSGWGIVDGPCDVHTATYVLSTLGFSNWP